MGACEDGEWAHWSTWGKCSTSCGDGGYQTRHRGVAKWPNHCGKSVEGDTAQFRECNRRPCHADSDCMFSNWSEWSPVVLPLPGRQRQHGRQHHQITRSFVWSRQRHVEREPLGGGKNCVGVLEEIRPCKNIAGSLFAAAVQECPTLEPAGSVPSGGGSSTGGGEDDAAKEVNKSASNSTATTAAPSSTATATTAVTVTPTCHFTAFTKWSNCTAPCGQGTQTRQREIIRADERKAEELEAGAQTAESCSAALQEIQSCNVESCSGPQDCSFSRWSNWTSCSVTCGVGSQFRTRVIEQVARRGGRACARNGTHEAQMCDTGKACKNKQSLLVLFSYFYFVPSAAGCSPEEVAV